MAKRIFLIAGEPSGDALGAALMQGLKAQSQEPVEFRGIGGDKMKAEGLQSLLPMEDLCVIGIWEVIWQLRRLMKIIHGLVEEIEEFDPHALVTIDLPDLNFQVASKIRKRGKTNAKLIHYVAPSVWAWRKKRADKISKFLDGVMCLLPFEPQYFPKIKAEFVGHPLVELYRQGDGDSFRRARNISPETKTLGLLFGSRMSEFKTHSELLKKAASMLVEIYPDMQLIVPTLPALEYEAMSLAPELPAPACIVSNVNLKWDAFAACDVAVAVSGTVGLELAFAKVPHIIVYKTHPITWAIMKLLVKVKYAHLANILLEKPVIPEFLQNKAQPIPIGKALLKLYKVEEARAKQAEVTQTLRDMLGGNDARTPSVRAADFVLSMIEGLVKTGRLPRPLKPKPESKVPAPGAITGQIESEAEEEIAERPAMKPLPIPLGDEIARLVNLAMSLIPKKK
jgi:lipid-A-disaccharide synthase